MARVHGFASVAALAESLPKNTKVLDVGAGASPFGKEIAALRPDITWVNFDYSYGDPSILSEVSKDRPPNLAFTAGDATKLENIYEAGHFDTVFSYWLLPHLSIDDAAPARAVSQAIFRLTKTGGYISVGPIIHKGRPLTFRARKAYHLIKDGSLDEDTFVDTAVQATRLHGVARYFQRLINEVATPFFRTTRYVTNEGGTAKIADPQSGGYVAILSLKGMSILLRLVARAGRYIFARSRRRDRKIG